HESRGIDHDPAYLRRDPPDDRLLRELRRCLLQGVFHRRPCRVRPGPHVLPRRFTGRAQFLQFLLRGVAAGTHCLELLLVLSPRVGAHLGAFGSQAIDLSVPFPDLRFHHRKVFIFFAHGETPFQMTSNSPAAPIPPPMHMVATTSLAPRRLPSIKAWPVSRAPDKP